MFRRKEAVGFQIANTIFFLIMIAVNFFAESMKLNNITTAEVSAKNDTPLTPAGFTFGIWGVIYVMLLLFILFQNGLFLKKGEGENPDILHAVNIFFIISSMANIAWVVLWHYEYIALCFVLILTVWVTLIFAYVRLQKEISSKKEHYFVQVPFSIYLGWISVAMAANFMAMLKQNLPGLLEIPLTQWTIGLVLGVFLLTEYYLFRYKDIVLALTVMWALAGLFYRYTVNVNEQNLQTDIILLLVVVMGILFMSLLIAAWMKHNQPQMRKGSGHRNFNH